MNVDGKKFIAIIEWYGREKGYAEKSFVSKFCEDFELNYNQWNAYTRGTQNVGTKIIQFLMEKFPRLNMNWFLKDAYNMWENESEIENLGNVAEKIPEEISLQAVSNKLEIVQSELKSLIKNQ